MRYFSETFFNEDGYSQEKADRFGAQSLQAMINAIHRGITETLALAEPEKSQELMTLQRVVREIRLGDNAPLLQGLLGAMEGLRETEWRPLQEAGIRLQRKVMTEEQVTALLDAGYTQELQGPVTITDPELKTRLVEYARQHPNLGLRGFHFAREADVQVIDLEVLDKAWAASVVITPPSFAANWEEVDGFFKNHPIRYLHVYGLMDWGRFDRSFDLETMKDLRLHGATTKRQDFDFAQDFFPLRVKEDGGKSGIRIAPGVDRADVLVKTALLFMESGNLVHLPEDIELKEKYPSGMTGWQVAAKLMEQQVALLPGFVESTQRQYGEGVDASELERFINDAQYYAVPPSLVENLPVNAGNKDEVTRLFAQFGELASAKHLTTLFALTPEAEHGKLIAALHAGGKGVKAENLPQLGAMQITSVEHYLLLFKQGVPLNDTHVVQAYGHAKDFEEFRQIMATTKIMPGYDQVQPVMGVGPQETLSWEQVGEIAEQIGMIPGDGTRIASYRLETLKDFDTLKALRRSELKDDPKTKAAWATESFTDEQLARVASGGTRAIGKLTWGEWERIGYVPAPAVLPPIHSLEDVQVAVKLTGLPYLSLYRSYRNDADKQAAEKAQERYAKPLASAIDWSQPGWNIHSLKELVNLGFDLKHLDVATLEPVFRKGISLEEALVLHQPINQGSARSGVFGREGDTYLSYLPEGLWEALVRAQANAPQKDTTPLEMGRTVGWKGSYQDFGDNHLGPSAWSYHNTGDTEAVRQTIVAIALEIGTPVTLALYDMGQKNWRATSEHHAQALTRLLEGLAGRPDVKLPDDIHLMFSREHGMNQAAVEALLTLVKRDPPWKVSCEHSNLQPVLLSYEDARLLNERAGLKLSSAVTIVRETGKEGPARLSLEQAREILKPERLAVQSMVVNMKGVEIDLSTEFTQLQRGGEEAKAAAEVLRGALQSYDPFAKAEMPMGIVAMDVSIRANLHGLLSAETLALLADKQLKTGSIALPNDVTVATGPAMLARTEEGRALRATIAGAYVLREHGSVERELREQLEKGTGLTVDVLHVLHEFDAEHKNPLWDRLPVDKDYRYIDFANVAAYRQSAEALQGFYRSVPQEVRDIVHQQLEDHLNRAGNQLNGALATLVRQTGIRLPANVELDNTAGLDGRELVALLKLVSGSPLDGVTVKGSVRDEQLQLLLTTPQYLPVRDHYTVEPLKQPATLVALAGAGAEVWKRIPDLEITVEAVSGISSATLGTLVRDHGHVLKWPKPISVNVEQVTGLAKADTETWGRMPEVSVSQEVISQLSSGTLVALMKDHPGAVTWPVPVNVNKEQLAGLVEADAAVWKHMPKVNLSQAVVGAVSSETLVALVRDHADAVQWPQPVSLSVEQVAVLQKEGVLGNIASKVGTVTVSESVLSVETLDALKQYVGTTPHAGVITFAAETQLEGKAAMQRFMELVERNEPALQGITQLRVSGEAFEVKPENPDRAHSAYIMKNIENVTMLDVPDIAHITKRTGAGITLSNTLVLGRQEMDKKITEEQQPKQALEKVTFEGQNILYGGWRYQTLKEHPALNGTKTSHRHSTIFMGGINAEQPVLPMARSHAEEKLPGLTIVMDEGNALKPVVKPDMPRDKNHATAVHLDAELLQSAVREQRKSDKGTQGLSS